MSHKHFGAATITLTPLALLFTLEGITASSRRFATCALLQPSRQTQHRKLETEFGN